MGKFYKVFGGRGLPSMRGDDPGRKEAQRELEEQHRRDRAGSRESTAREPSVPEERSARTEVESASARDATPAPQSASTRAPRSAPGAAPRPAPVKPRGSAPRPSDNRSSARASAVDRPARVRGIGPENMLAWVILAIVVGYLAGVVAGLIALVCGFAFEGAADFLSAPPDAKRTPPSRADRANSPGPK